MLNRICIHPLNACRQRLRQALDRYGSRRAALWTTIAVLFAYALFLGYNLQAGGPRKHDEFLTLSRSNSFVVHGDWLAMYYNQEASFRKPPLQYMLTAGLLMTGMNENLALRIWPFLFTIGLLASTAWLARTALPDRPWVGPLAVVLLCSSPLLLLLGRSGLLETGMAFFTVSTAAASLRARENPRFWILSGCLAGLGGLQKAPLALGLMLLAAMITLLPAASRPREKRSYGWLAAGTGIAVVMTVSWPVLQWIRFGSAAVNVFLKEEMAERFQPGVQLNLPNWYHPLWQDSGVVWMFCLVAIAIIVFHPHLKRNPGLQVCALFLLLFILAMTAATGNVYGRYLLVALPFLATCGAAVISILPRRMFAIIIVFVMVASSAPKLLSARNRADNSDVDILKSVVQAFHSVYDPEAMPVFVTPEPWNAFPSSAFIYYAALDRKVLVLEYHRKLTMLEGVYAQGVCAAADLERLQHELANLNPVLRQDGFVIWEHRPGLAKPRRLPAQPPP